MAEPRQGYRTVGTLVVGQLTHHLRFGTGVAQHVDKVKHHHIQRVLLYLLHLLHQLVGIGLGVYLVIRKSLLTAIALQLGTNQRFLVQVLTLLLVFIHPEVGEHLLYLVRHQTTEDGVACILRGGGQDAVIHVLVDIKVGTQFARQHAPLVVTEVIEHHQEHLLARIEHGEHLGFKYLGRKNGLLSPTCYPIQIILLDKLGKAVVGLLLLHLQHLGHGAFGGTQLQLPVYQALVHLHPIIPRFAVHYLHGYLLEVLLILALCDFCFDGTAVDILLECQQYLIGVYGLYQVVGNLLSDGLLHNVLLLALGNHHHSDRGINLLELAQGFETADTRHLLIQQHQIEVALTAQVESIGTVANGHDLIAFLLEEHDVALELLNLVVYPK